MFQMITFSHAGKSVSLGPSMFLLNDPFADITEKDAIKEDIEKGDENNNNNNNNKDNKYKVLKVGSILHSLHETKSTKSKRNIPQSEGTFSRHDVINDINIHVTIIINVLLRYF